MSEPAAERDTAREVAGARLTHPGTTAGDAVSAIPSLFDIDVPDGSAPTQTERAMLDLVHARFNVHNGVSPRYVVAEHVGLDPMWPARILDAVVADTWRSGAFALHGIEVKISRSDLVRELDDPNKAGAFCAHLDFFWLAVPDKRTIRDLAVPAKWGVLTVCNGGLRQARRATRLRPAAVTGWNRPDPLPRLVQVSMLRAVRKTYEAVTR